jgi:uncharacterized protein YqeY
MMMNMTLNKLQSELIQARKNRDKDRTLVLSDIVGSVQKAAIDKNCRDNITESLVDEVLLKYKKTVQEMIDTCPAECTEYLEKYNQKMAIVSEFAPTIITNELEIELAVRRLILDNNIEPIKSNRGAIMKLVAANLKGKADMGIVSKVVGGMLR